MISKILKLVEDKVGAIKLLVFICIGAIVELLSIAALLPAIFLISNQSDNPILNFFKEFFNELNPNLSESNFAFTVLIVLIFLFLIKFIYVTFLSYYQATFALNLEVKLSNFLLKKYLKAKHQFHVNNNSAIIIRNVNNEVNIFYKHIFTPLMISILEIIIATVMVIFLLFYNPITTIIILAIMIFLFFIYFFYFKKRFFGWGKERLFHDGMKLKNLKESIDFVKLIKFMKKEDFFLKKFKFHNRYSNLVSRRFSVMFVIPRLSLEFFLVLIIASIGIFLISKGGSLNYFFETATVYITIAYRLIPSLTRLSTSFQAMSGTKASLDTLVKIYDSNELKDDEINFNQNKKLKKISFNKMIELVDINFKYENKTETTLENLNFKINKGEFIGIIGDTGSGKSTLVDLLLGIFKPTSGKIKVDGNILEKNSMLNYGYVPQQSSILDETIANNIAFGEENENINRDLIEEVIKISKIDKFINNLPDGLETVLSERGENLSGGQAQRINIARALYFKPDILILDEATSALDLKTEAEFLKDLLNLKKFKTIILISHRKESMIYCDNIYELKDKKIILKK
tara:strand:- start:10 stop:1731 length:1722 start_codon:yes stop_codon:yes gene_type:complete